MMKAVFKQNIPIAICISLIASLLFSASTCEKQNEVGSIKGKLVYRSCATIAVEVLDSDYFSLAQPDWVQDPSGTTRHNVFAVTNSCEFPLMDTGRVFSFKLTSNGKKDCIICMMFDNPPVKKQAIIVDK